MDLLQRALSRTELDTAGIRDPALRAGYARCKELHAAHGRTYFLATLLLPPAKRPYVDALYAFARCADEIVDDLGSTSSVADRAERLRRWGDSFLAAAAHGSGDRRHPDDPVCAAMVDTVRRWSIPLEHVEAFLRSMAMDLTVTGYATYADLLDYVHGSAAVIGLQMLPILEPLHPTACDYARDLGIGFQLANFVRDVGEDLRRGRVYLPQEDLDAFEVSRAHLAGGVVDGRVRRLLAFEIARTREVLRAAAPGIALLHPTSRDCVRTALELYGGILDAVEDADYQVLDRRVAVSARRRAAVAAPALLRARRARQERRGVRRSHH